MYAKLPTPELDRVRIRSFRPDDKQAIFHLYSTGLLTGQNDPHDALTDLHELATTYLSHPHNHFWIAECDGEVIGMVGIHGQSEWVAEVCRLRVDANWHQTRLPCRLVQTALRHARDHGYLKVVLNTHSHSERKITLLTSLGFQHHRDHDVNGKRVMEFYVNLYQDPEK